jgi:hypothetical protein
MSNRFSLDEPRSAKMGGTSSIDWRPVVLLKPPRSTASGRSPADHTTASVATRVAACSTGIQACGRPVMSNCKTSCMLTSFLSGTVLGVVPQAGLEPATPGVSSRRSTH